jgi:RNA ligase (TIGR02306 family)
MGITKYEPAPDLVFGGENEKDLGFWPQYTDIEGYRRWPDILQEAEPVNITEKIHGTNSRYLYKDGRLWTGSHHCIKRFNPLNLYWRVAMELDLENRLKSFENLAIYGEIYGNGVQDLKYGESKQGFRLFDIMDTNTRKYLNHDDFLNMADKMGLSTVPSLYRGPWNKSLLELAEGKTTLSDNHVREGIVIKPLVERFDPSIQRVILKYIGESYLLRK